MPIAIKVHDIVQRTTDTVFLFDGATSVPAIIDTPLAMANAIIISTYLKKVTFKSSDNHKYT